MFTCLPENVANPRSNRNRADPLHHRPVVPHGTVDVVLAPVRVQIRRLGNARVRERRPELAEKLLVLGAPHPGCEPRERAVDQPIGGPVDTHLVVHDVEPSLVSHIPGATVRGRGCVPAGTEGSPPRGRSARARPARTRVPRLRRNWRTKTSSMGNRRRARMPLSGSSTRPSDAEQRSIRQERLPGPLVPGGPLLCRGRSWEVSPPPRRASW